MLSQRIPFFLCPCPLNVYQGKVVSALTFDVYQTVILVFGGLVLLFLAHWALINLELPVLHGLGWFIDTFIRRPAFSAEHSQLLWPFFSALFGCIGAVVSEVDSAWRRCRAFVCRCCYEPVPKKLEGERFYLKHEPHFTPLQWTNWGGDKMLPLWPSAAPHLEFLFVRSVKVYVMFVCQPSTS